MGVVKKFSFERENLIEITAINTNLFQIYKEFLNFTNKTTIPHKKMNDLINKIPLSKRIFKMPLTYPS